LSPRARRVLAGAIEALIVAVSVVIVIGCVMLMTGPMWAQRSPSLGLPVMYFVAGTAVGFTLMAMESLRQLVRLMSGDPALAEADRPEPGA
jgi:TRAP-type C4-dicarboxylate transport system permease small subunit